MIESHNLACLVKLTRFELFKRQKATQEIEVRYTTNSFPVNKCSRLKMWKNVTGMNILNGTIDPHVMTCSDSVSVVTESGTSPIIYFVFFSNVAPPPRSGQRFIYITLLLSLSSCLPVLSSQMFSFRFFSLLAIYMYNTHWVIWLLRLQLIYHSCRFCSRRNKSGK